MEENKPYPSDAFFKVLLDSSSPILSIPPNFICRYGDKMLEKCELETNGKSYTVRIEKIGKLNYFTNGWLKFVEANGLKDGYFLVFQLNQETSGFSVVVYDLSQTSCSDKQHLSVALPTRENCAKVKEEPPQSLGRDHLPDPLPTSVKRAIVKEEPPESSDEPHVPGSLPTSNKRRRVDKEKSEAMENDSENPLEPYINIENEDGDDDFREGHEGSSDCSNLSFSVTFKERDWVAIPKDFAMKTGMAKLRRITLKDSNGKRWPVDLRPVKDGKMKMTYGWDEFQRAFRVDRNVTCTFEFRKKHADVLKVKVKRGRGRPHILK